MGKTMIEKIIEYNTKIPVKADDIVTVQVDRVMIHDIFIPFVAENLRKWALQTYGIRIRLF